MSNLPRINMYVFRGFFSKFAPNYSKRLGSISRKMFSSASETTIDPSGPVFQKYLERLQIEPNATVNYSAIVSSLRERVVILNDIKNLEELRTEDKKGDANELIELEKEQYVQTLKLIDEKILATLLSGKLIYPHSDCILEISCGVGGQEAMLFAKELMIMYQNFASYRGWKTQLSHEDVSDCGGIRQSSLLISGVGAYDILKLEAGVHRVQRVPATEKSGRLHTSTATVAVMLQPDEIEISLPDRDLRIERKRSSGAGGQSVNTTDSCVRIFHLPTGLIVESQVEKDQHRNKSLALARLRAILYQRQLDSQIQKERNERKSQVGSSQRNEKIRTYNFNQDRVTDHRLGASTGTVHGINGVLKGGDMLDSLIVRLQTIENRNKLFREIESLEDTS